MVPVGPALTLLAALTVQTVLKWKSSVISVLAQKQSPAPIAAEMANCKKNNGLKKRSDYFMVIPLFVAYSEVVFQNDS